MNPSVEVHVEPSAPSTARRLDLMPPELLEREITELAAHIHAATCRFLLLVRELDRREGWAEWGCRSCAHWLSWQCAIGLGAAREHVRVARCLDELPAIRAAFGRGMLSFSQVRAMTRVATPETEEELLEIAEHATAAQLEGLIRRYRGVLEVELGDADARYRRRYVNCSNDDHGSLLIEARLPAEEGALVLAALDAARDALRTAKDVSAETSLNGEADSTQGATDDEDVSAETPPDARAVSNADALVLMADTLLGAGPVARRGGERHQVVVNVDAETLAGAREDGVCELERGGALHPETARRLACDASVVRIMERDGRPLSVGRKSRSVPPALRRALQSRDRGCRFPGCCERRFVDAHHIEHWAHGGATDLSNLVLLCRHHHRLLHEGGYRIRRTSAAALAFRAPDGRKLPDRPASGSGDARELARGNAGAGLCITPETCIPNWDGSRIKHGWEVERLSRKDPRFPPD
jgi:Domain of unknown function (DUF222)/HNH endonuclease